MIYLLRFFTGYVVFRISGSRTGGFINMLTRRCINIWGIKAHGGDLYCCAVMRDYPEIQRLSKGTSQRVHIVKKRGLPFILHKNKRRSGLLVGVVLFAVIFRALSLFVWTIDICRFDTLSQSAAKEIFERIGVYEGVRSDFESLKRLQTKAMLEFGDLSWLTINIDGSRGEINATEKIQPETNDTAPRNMTASKDGQIIRIDAFGGVPAVSPGDGVVKGDMLISGVVETELGGRHLEHADGIALAKTHGTEQLELPKERYVMTTESEPVVRYSAKLFDLYFPLTVCETPKEYITFKNETRAQLFGECASASLIKEDIYAYKAVITDTDRQKAEELFKTRLLLKELFCHNEKEIIKRSVTVTELENGFHCTAEYTFEENIAVPSRLTRADLFREISSEE